LVYDIVGTKMFLHAILPVLLIFITIIILSTLFYGIYYVIENKKQIDQNWPQYKCRPYVFPFAGILIGPNTTNPVDNFRDCSWLIFKSFFDVLISPFIQILTIIVSILTNFTNDIQNIRKMVSYMRSSIRSIALDLYAKMKDAYYRLAFVYKSFMKVFAAMFQSMQASYNTLLYSYYTMSSMWNGPIGGAARFFCFDGNTLIKMSDGTFKAISQIELGEQTQGGAVLGCYKFSADSMNMYLINGDIVSGSHLIFENDKWIRVADSPNAEEIMYHHQYIYSLQTAYSTLYTPTNIFKDYDELNDNSIKFNIYLNQLTNLNAPLHREISEYMPTTYPSKPINHIFKTLFDSRTPIPLTNGTTKCIKDIVIGDVLSVSGKVLGVVKCQRLPGMTMYRTKNGVICSHGTVIYADSWIPVNIEPNSSLHYSESESESKNILYSLLTESGTIFINYMTFRDHDMASPTFEPIVNDYITHLVNQY